jgi:hypothetical protein
VLPHGPIEKLADNLYTVVGRLRMPLGETTRRMTIARLASGGLAIYSAIALDEPEMARLESFGHPEFLIVPSGLHRIDAKAWKDRYPNIIVIAPAGARDKVHEVVAIDATRVDLGDRRVRIHPVPGTARRELAMLVETRNGKTTLVVNDLIFNLPRYKGLLRLGMRALGFKPGQPTIPKLVKKRLVTDDDAMRSQLRAWADLDLERILVAHGAPIENARETLLELAAA